MPACWPAVRLLRREWRVAVLELPGRLGCLVAQALGWHELAGQTAVSAVSAWSSMAGCVAVVPRRAEPLKGERAVTQPLI